MAANGTGHTIPKQPVADLQEGMAHAEPDLTGEIVVFEVDDEALSNVRSKPKILQNSLIRNAARNVGLICIWYFFSTLLSVFNKKLIGREDGLWGQGGFPAPLLFACTQFAVQHMLARCTLATGLVKRKAGDPLNWNQYTKTVVPNGISTGLDIGLSLLSLHFITLSFYTMCKATSPLFLLFFAILWGLERLNLSLVAIVGTITPGLALLVHGERKFDLAGFLLVMSASAMSGLRWTYTQLQLQGAHGGGFTGGPLEVLEQLTPVASITMGTLSLMVERPWTLTSSPYFQSLEHTAYSFGLMALGGFIAFLMVWSEFQVISFTSALTLMIAGTVKELVTVVAGVMCFGDEFTPVNGLGMVIVILGVVLYNIHKYKRIKKGELVGHHSSVSRKNTELGADHEKVPMMPESPKHLGSDLIKKKRLQLEMEAEAGDLLAKKAAH